MIKNSVDIITLGCSKNLVDSERLMHRFSEAGYKVRHDPEKVSSEFVVVNTCGFIGDAKEESIEMILRMVEAKKAHKIHHLYVMGCLSQRYREELETEIPEVDKFYGKFDWTDLLTDLGSRISEEKDFGRILTTPPHYAYVKIAEGCNRFCSYCAIPLITGRFVSYPMEQLLDEVKSLVSQGVKEFQIIAQDLSSYGLDLYGKLKLPELIDRMAQIPGVKWIRLHYAYPSQFPYEILPVIQRHDNVCKYLDIALQHISDHVLVDMRRHVTKQETYDLLKRIRTEVPGIHIRTTLMVGYPGETDKVKQARLDELMALQEEIALESNASKVGQIFDVIVDREEEDYYVGRTEYDSPEVDPEVLIAKDRFLTVGDFCRVKVVEALPFELMAVPVELD